MPKNLHPDIKIKIESPDDGTAVLRKGSIATVGSYDRPQSSPPRSPNHRTESLSIGGNNLFRPISLSVENVRNQRPLSFSHLMHDIESKKNNKTALEERKLRELLNTMKHVKGNTLIVLVVETFLYHMCFYVADVVTDIVNGYYYYETGKLININLFSTT